MPDNPVFAAVLAAGKGTRMRSNRAKVLHTICGVPMVNYAISALKPLEPRRTLVVVGHQADEVRTVLPPGVEPVLQKEQKGTGDAVRVALERIEGEEGTLLVVNGDGPLISDETLARLVERHRSAGVGATVLVAELPDPTGLGRVTEDGGVVRIVEERDATEDERGGAARQPRALRLRAPGDTAGPGHHRLGERPGRALPHGRAEGHRRAQPGRHVLSGEP
jgi:bifunctional UDP-N-acetylglucosamine pyrophosphorylase/glucosamine-1-phosphate N-acetyltransferase